MSRMHALTIVVMAACAIPWAGDASAGTGTTSDAFGYTMDDSHDPSGPSFAFIDISGTGQPLYLGDDDASDPIPIGFSFEFYGTTYSQVHINSNGYISFGRGFLEQDNDCPIPQPMSGIQGANNLIAPMWMDLDPSDRSDIVYWQHMPSCLDGGACFIVQYHEFRTIDGDEAGTFQVVLRSSGEILLQYQSVGEIDGYDSTTGIENQDGTDGLSYACNTSSTLHDGLAVRFVPPDIVPNCPGDLDGDGVVTIGDLNAVLGNFGTGFSSGDANGDGLVDIADLNLILGNFGVDC